MKISNTCSQSKYFLIKQYFALNNICKFLITLLKPQIANKTNVIEIDLLYNNCRYVMVQEMKGAGRILFHQDQIRQSGTVCRGNICIQSIGRV